MIRRGMLVLGALAAGCSSSPELARQEHDVKVDTASDLAWAQHQANLAFGQSYQAACPPRGDDERPRVLVTGFGRFQSQRVNATGMIVSELLEALDYPFTEPPEPGEVDAPAPQTAVAHGVVELATMGEVEVCAMVLPVFWDLASYLVLREAESFTPDLVVMNGVAGWRQSLWIELGAVNRAVRSRDGSNILKPLEPGSPLLPEAGDAELARGNLATWEPLRDAARSAVEQLGELEEDGVRFDSVLKGADLAGFPRSSNTYLCNNTTFTVGYALDHPGEPLTLMEASELHDEDADGALSLAVDFDGREVPRWFMHWPSDLEGEHIPLGAEVMRRVLDAQLAAEAPPIGGDAVEPDYGG